MTRLTTPISDHAQPKFLDQVLVYVNLYQHAKNQGISLICSGCPFSQFWGQIIFLGKSGCHAQIHMGF